MNDIDLDDQLRRWRDDTLSHTSEGSQPHYPDTGLGRGRRTTVAMAAVAAAVAAIILGATTSSRDLSPAVAVVEMTRTLTYLGLALDVPQSWSTNAQRCGTPTENTVLVGGLNQNQQCRVTPVPVGTVELQPLPTDRSSWPITGGTWQSIDVDGLPALQRSTVASPERPTTLTELESAAWPDITYYRTDIVVPGLNAWVAVQAPDQATTNTIIASIRRQ